MASRTRFDTHEVFNQSPAYEDVDLFLSDVPLQDAIKANGADSEAPMLAAFGKHWGTAEMFALGRRANENPPKLRAFDGNGVRRDTVEFHPAYHQFMRESIAAGLHASTWAADGRRASAPAEVARAARFYIAAQGRDRTFVPDHHDARRAGCARRRPVARGESRAQGGQPQLRPAVPAMAR
jgi:putative acyl-CoA dehydrogenase